MAKGQWSHVIQMQRAELDFMVELDLCAECGTPGNIAKDAKTSEITIYFDDERKRDKWHERLAALNLTHTVARLWLRF